MFEPVANVRRPVQIRLLVKVNVATAPVRDTLSQVIPFVLSVVLALHASVVLVVVTLPDVYFSMPVEYLNVVPFDMVTFPANVQLFCKTPVDVDGVYVPPVNMISAVPVLLVLDVPNVYPPAQVKVSAVVLLMVVDALAVTNPVFTQSPTSVIVLVTPKVNGVGHVLPLLVNVAVTDPATARVDEPEIVIPDASVTLPYVVNNADIVSVPVNPVQFIVRHALDTLTVNVLVPEDAVRNTSSAEVGNEAPDAPPSVADQLVVEFQFPVPPPTK